MYAENGCYDCETETKAVIQTSTVLQRPHYVTVSSHLLSVFNQTHM